MPEPVTIPLSFFEFVAGFERPVFKLWVDRAAVMQAIFDSLTPWKPTVDDIEAVNTGKTSEQGLTIKLPAKSVSFFFGPALCRFVRDNVSWELVEETLAILASAVSALTASGGVVLGRKDVALGMHLQPKTLPFTTLLSPFIASQLRSQDSKEVINAAAVAQWVDYKVTLDGSAVLANAIFLRFDRQFPSETSYENIANQLRKDQAELFKMLGVEEER